MRWIDLAIIAVYLVFMVWIGLRMARRQTSTEAYFVARRSIPSWAIGLTTMATLVSSVTFIAYPGAAYGGNWSLLIPGMMLVVVLAAIGPVIVPFYREAVGMSAYEYFGQRFGTPTRVYASVAFALGHFGKMGFVYYLVGLTLNSMTGWNLDVVIVIVGVVTVFYTVIGGIEAVVWTDVIQGLIMWVGVFACLGVLLFLPPGGPGAVFDASMANRKFSLGGFDWDFRRESGAVLALYGVFWYLQKYCADQTIVQRYLLAPSDRKALRGMAYGAAQTLGIWALFMAIGTFTWAFYRLTGERLPAHIAKADQVFPYFLGTQMPVGVTGVFMAALMAAAMSTLASDLNCLAAVGVEDVYRRLRPNADDARRLRTGKVMVAVFGVLGVLMAEVLAHSKGGALSLWFSVSAIMSGGLAGLFLLAFLTKRAHRKGVYVGIAAGLAFTAWASLTGGKGRLLSMGGWNYGWHEQTIGAVAHVILFVVGYLASLAIAGPADGKNVPTLWEWLKRGGRHSLRGRAGARVP